MSGNGSTNCLSLPSIIKAHKRSLGQGNVFTPVCDSVHRGVFVQGGLCPGGGVFVHGGRGLCPGGEGSLSRGRGLCPGGGVFVRETPPCTVKCGQYASYWNEFLLNFNYGSKSNSSWEYDSQKTDMILMLSYFNYSLYCAVKDELFLFGKSNSIKEAAAPSFDHHQRQYWVRTNVRCFFPPTIVVIVII